MEWSHELITTRSCLKIAYAKKLQVASVLRLILLPSMTNVHFVEGTGRHLSQFSINYSSNVNSSSSTSLTSPFAAFTSSTSNSVAFGAAFSVGVGGASSDSGAGLIGDGSATSMAREQGTVVRIPCAIDTDCSLIEWTCSNSGSSCLCVPYVSASSSNGGAIGGAQFGSVERAGVSTASCTNEPKAECACVRSTTNSASSYAGLSGNCKCYIS